MKIVNMCGKRGLGDLVATTGYILDSLVEDTHIIFNYPKGHGYQERFKFIMNEFVMPENIKVTYEVNEEWSTVNQLEAIKRFGYENRYKTWFFSDKLGYGIYRPFKTQWKKDNQKSIGLVLNYNDAQRTERLFSTELNNILLDLVDNNNYYLIGGNVEEPLTDVINTIMKCKVIIGFDTSWAHITNCMRAPYILCKNKLDIKTLFYIYWGHPTLTIINEEDVFSYLI